MSPWGELVEPSRTTTIRRVRVLILVPVVYTVLARFTKLEVRADDHAERPAPGELVGAGGPPRTAGRGTS